MSDRKKTPSSWDPHDDMILRHLKEQLKLGWKEIAANFPNRTTNACQFRWRRLMSGNLKSQQSTPEATAPTSPSTGPSSPTRSNSVSVSNINNANNNNNVNMNNNSNFADPYQTQASYSMSRPWTADEDNLLISRKDLRSDELALLLPQRTETEIAMRASSLQATPFAPMTTTSPVPDLARDRSSSVASSVSSISSIGGGTSSGGNTAAMGSSPISPNTTYSINNTTYFSGEVKRPVLSKPRTPYFEGLKKLPTPVIQRRQSLPYYNPRSPSISGSSTNYPVISMNHPVIDTSS